MLLHAPLRTNFKQYRSKIFILQSRLNQASSIYKCPVNLETELELQLKILHWPTKKKTLEQHLSILFLQSLQYTFLVSVSPGIK